MLKPIVASFIVAVRCSRIALRTQTLRAAMPPQAVAVIVTSFDQSHTNLLVFGCVVLAIVSMRGTRAQRSLTSPRRTSTLATRSQRRPR